MAKLDPVQIRYIINQKDKGKSPKEIAKETKVCVGSKTVCPVPQDKKGPCVEKARKATDCHHWQGVHGALKVLQSVQVGAVGIEKALDRSGIHILHNTIHKILRDSWQSHSGSSRVLVSHTLLPNHRTCIIGVMVTHSVV